MSLAFEQVSYCYSKQDAKKNNRDAFALKDISFALEDGAFLGIMGHTGSGKSTLIQHINGILQPTSGRVLLDGQDLSNKDVRKSARKKVGMVIQRPEQQLFAPTVAEDVAFGPRNMGIADDKIDELVNQALKKVGLDPNTYWSRSPHQLSGGEARRVAFAGVLAYEPQLLVLDEPTAGLDPKGSQEIMELVATLNRQGSTIIMASHSMEDIARYSTHILVLNQGEIFTQGAPAQVFTQAQELRRINLGVPGATSFAQGLREGGFNLPDDIYTLEDLADAIALDLGYALPGKATSAAADTAIASAHVASPASTAPGTHLLGGEPSCQ